MKILGLGDPHGRLPPNLKFIIHKNRPDIIICTGDFGEVKRNPDGTGNVNSRNLPKIIKELSSYGLPVLVLKGNMYLSRKTKKIFTDEINKYKNIHYKDTGKLNIRSEIFLFFDMIYEEYLLPGIIPKNKTIRKKMRLNLRRGKKLYKMLGENKNSILITHNPPYGYLDKIQSGKHVGSKIILNAIKKYQPKLVLCGHIHEAKGKAKIRKTEVYNLGCCGDYKIIEV